MMMKENSLFFEKENITIIQNAGKYGLMSDSEIILPMEYDNIFVYGRYLYVLHKGGKIGAIRFEDTNLSYKTTAETKYDTLDFYWHDLLFSDGKEFVYYFCDAQEYGFESTYIFSSVSIEERNALLYASDNENYYIFRRGSGEMLWCEKKIQDFMIDKPCYSYQGDINGKPMFFDITHGDFITPEEDGYRRHKKFYLDRSVVVNGENVINIIQNADKFGLLDTKNLNCVIPRYDKIECTLLVKSNKAGISSTREYELFSTSPPATV